MQKSEIQIVWFKRYLRTTDHKPLFEASKTLKPILPIYVVENEYWKQSFSNKRHWCKLGSRTRTKTSKKRNNQLQLI